MKTEIKPVIKQEQNDLDELRRQIANEEAVQAYDRDRHIQEVKSKIIKDLNEEIPVKITEEMYLLGLQEWFLIITQKYENASRLKRLFDKSNEEESEFARSYNSFEDSFKF